MCGSDATLQQLSAQAPALAKAGVNALVVEVDYNFQFRSRREMNSPQGISYKGAAAFAKVCKAYGIRVIPELNCLGHQSWQQWTGPLLTTHPDFDETPGQYPDNKGIYCRSWCPENPQVWPVVEDLIDELIDAFHADGFHVGMDEVQIIGSPFCPRCRGKDPAKLFALAVNTLHQHIVKRRRVEMFMWGDRLLDASATYHSDYESSSDGTAPAIDLIPKDIVICDWHYENRSDYPSLKILLDKGFRVWPSSWNDVAGTSALGTNAKAAANPQVVGQLVTTWSVNIADIPTWAPFKAAMNLWRP
jgi:hypothetical protein